MAIDKAVDSGALDTALTYTADRIRAKTGSTDQIAWDAAKGFGDAVDEISEGGGATTPAIAVAQFPVMASIEEDVGSLTIDFSELQQYMSATKTYNWTLIMWRNSQAVTSKQYVAGSYCVTGRASKGSNLDANDCRLSRTAAAALATPYSLNVMDFKKSRTVTGTALTIVSNATSTEWVGDFIGVFTLLASYTDTHTGDKPTECPAGFLTFAAAEESAQSADIPAEDALNIITGGVV